MLSRFVGGDRLPRDHLHRFANDRAAVWPPPRDAPVFRDPRNRDGIALIATKDGVSILCPDGARPAVPAMIRFIDDYCGAYGVEPACRV